MEGLHRSFLNRQVTLFAPTNSALAKFKGRKHSENLILNHMTNIALRVDQFPEKLTTLVTGNPPLWMVKSRTRGVSINQARILRENLGARSERGDEQMLHVIDSVLEPLVPISLRDAEYFVQLDALKLASKSTLYDLGGHRVRVFSGQAELNRKSHMFSVPGQHTFFMPVDEAFDVSVQLSGYDYDRNRLKNDGSGRHGVAGGNIVNTGVIKVEPLFSYVNISL